MRDEGLVQTDNNLLKPVFFLFIYFKAAII